VTKTFSYVCNTCLPWIRSSQHRLLQEARFLIHQQRYLELLDEGSTTSALSVLRNDLAPLNVDPEQLQQLSRYVLAIIILGADFYGYSQVY
jgi:hypothetical protein